MKNYHLFIIALILILSSLFGCSAIKEQFNDEDIILNVINSETTEEYRAYGIELTNKTGFELTHLSMNLSYPIEDPSGSEVNPFVIEGKVDKLPKPINLKSGEAVIFSFLAPIKDVFDDTKTLNFESPNVKLEGYFKKGNEEIPFGMSGGLKVFDYMEE